MVKSVVKILNESELFRLGYLYNNEVWIKIAFLQLNSYKRLGLVD